MHFLKMSTFGQTRLATETHLADEELLQVKKNMEELLTLRGRFCIAAVNPKQKDILNLNK